MKLKDSIRESLGKIFLKKNVKKIHRIKAFHNFDSAKTAGIIFNATNQDSYLQAKSFMAFLIAKNIEVSGLGFVGGKELLGYFPYHKGIDFFSIKEVNWHARPTTPVVNAFIEKPFDMLIDLSLDSRLPIQYIIGMSKAKFKISKRFDFIDSDFMIHLNGNSSVPYFIDQVKHYMAALSTH